MKVLTGPLWEMGEMEEGKSTLEEKQIKSFCSLFFLNVLFIFLLCQIDCIYKKLGIFFAKNNCLHFRVVFIKFELLIEKLIDSRFHSVAGVGGSVRSAVLDDKLIKLFL